MRRATGSDARIVTEEEAERQAKELIAHFMHENHGSEQYV